MRTSGCVDPRFGLAPDPPGGPHAAPPGEEVPDRDGGPPPGGGAREAPDRPWNRRGARHSAVYGDGGDLWRVMEQLPVLLGDRARVDG